MIPGVEDIFPLKAQFILEHSGLEDIFPLKAQFICEQLGLEDIFHWVALQ